MDTSSCLPAPNPAVDHRRGGRLLASYRARVRLGPRIFADCRTHDIGVGGVGLWSPEPVATGRTVQLALQLPDTHRGGPPRMAMASALVVSHVPAGKRFRIGLQWVTPNSAALDSLTQWLQRPDA